jgi:5-methyltetrahydrofolate--homocysteine methyltransferase
MVMIQGQEKPPGTELPHAPGFVPQLPADMPPDEVVDRYWASREVVRYYGDAWPKWWVNFGAGAVAAFLGANLSVDSRTVWFEPSERVSIGDLHPQYDPDNAWWRRATDVGRTACEKWQGQIQVGHIDLGGNLDILASLLTTERLLMDCLDAPEEVDRLIGEISALWLRYYDEFHDIVKGTGRGTTPWAPILSPGRCYMLQCDFAYMISPEMFERFVVPDLTACCEKLDHGFYHLDGVGQIPHVDLLLGIERLRGIQWIPGAGQPPAAEWLSLLKRFRDGGKLCQIHCSPEGALSVVKELGGKGFALWIGEEMTAQEADDFLKQILA